MIAASLILVLRGSGNLNGFATPGAEVPGLSTFALRYRGLKNLDRYAVWPVNLQPPSCYRRLTRSKRVSAS